MEYRRIGVSEINALWELQKLYKAEIGEDLPADGEKDRLLHALQNGQILFFGAYENNTPVGCCSVSRGFSTFNYRPCGVFEDFYILPAYRHKGVARALVRYAYENSGVSSLTVGSADCDVDMYSALGFSVPLGNLLAFE